MSNTGKSYTIDNWSVYLEKAKLYFEENWLKKGNSTVAIKDFDIIRTIGTGSFGRVVLARYSSTDRFYAVKLLEKVTVLKLKQLEHTLNEKRILQSTLFPFCVHMELFFKDNSYLYMVMPYIAGGEMFSHLRKVRKYSEGMAVFYSAQIVLALEYLHYLDVVYRDLKPENILIDHRGYLKLTDLGFCKIVKGRTYTLCGTPEYLAPEIILSKGYGLSVDWWSLGVLIYEMCAGYPPFYSPDPMKIYEQIISGKYRVLATFTFDLKDLLSNLLQVEISKRCGSLRDGVDDIKKHKWYSNIVWMHILNKRIQAPYVPNIKGHGDTSHFDNYDEEPLSISEVPMFDKEFDDF